jgi:shikimate 5-dehydrogenase
MSERFDVVTKREPTMYFIGVTTTGSSIMRAFPLWMRELGRPDVVLEGMDLKIHDEPRAYRAAVAQIKHDPLSLGALVTTHKIDLYEAAKDLFEFLDPYARICGELSSISSRDGRLEGHAKDPITAGLSMDAIVPPGYFARTGAHVLCFGAGGSAVATLLHLIEKPDRADRPRRFIVVNRSQARLERMKAMVAERPTDIAVEYVWNADPVRNDAIMAALSDGSVVINATGMGKDIPGSPITNGGRFPRRGIAWEFNYRGELDFLHQARAQAASRELTVEDGWLYFLHGWTQVIAQVLHVDLDPPRFAGLAKVAESVRRRGGGGRSLA